MFINFIQGLLKPERLKYYKTLDFGAAFCKPHDDLVQKKEPAKPIPFSIIKLNKNYVIFSASILHQLHAPRRLIL